jgi:hypothetical protein
MIEEIPSVPRTANTYSLELGGRIKNKRNTTKKLS